MRIEVSVPGIEKERGKLPPPITRGPLRLVLPLAAGPLICGELVEPASKGAVTGAEVCEPVATPHPVNAETTKRLINPLRQRIGSSEVSSRRTPRGASFHFCTVRQVPPGRVS
jgi:hypothetical protein